MSRSCFNCYYYSICKNDDFEIGSAFSFNNPYPSEEQYVASNCANYKDKSLICELPCEVGYPVYIIADYKVLKCEVCEISINIWSGIEIKLMEYDTEKMIPSFFDERDFGEILFLTKTEAERKLKELEDGDL